MSLDILTSVGTAIKLAWKIYEKGFTKEKSSPQRYLEFGDALQHLRSNLTNIESIIKTANNGLENQRLGPHGPSPYDLSSLTDIVGNFRLTLEECRDWLNDDTKFYQSNGFITNIIYNINVDSQVVHLTERIAFHNTKIALVLDTFKFHIQTQLSTLHQEQHQDTAERIQELSRLMIATLDPDAEEISRPTRDLDVPLEISERFESALTQNLQGESMESSSTAGIPLRDALEAFFHHFNPASQDIDSMSYLRLMKSIWIMDRIRESADWAQIQQTEPGGLYDRCVRAMDRKLRVECTRVAASSMPRHSVSILLQLPDENFSIWPKVIPDVSSSIVDNLGVLLDIPILPHSKRHTLRMVRNIDGTLGVEDTTITTSESAGIMSSEKVTQKLNIDPPNAYFIPIYAMPTEPNCSSPSLTIKLQSSRNGVNGIAPEFISSSDLLRLQHLITGYRCVKQRNGISVKSLVKGQAFPISYTKGKRKSSDMFEYGNLQLWQKTSFEKRSSVVDETLSPRRQRSDTQSPTSRPTPESSLSFSAPSFISNMSAAHTQQISLGSTLVGIELRQPTPPLLVLFLKQRDSDLLSFLVIELDERTKVNPKSCDCRSPKKTCAVSVLERSGEPLLARRFYSTGGLNGWNLAAVGQNWSPSEPGSVQVQNMYWLRMRFSNEQERVKFNSNMKDLVTIFTGRMIDYQKDLKMVKATSIITRDY